MNDEDFTNSDLADCGSCSKKRNQCISFFDHENDIMHQDMENERAHKTTWFVCATVITITLIFVIAYTMRMNTFIDLIREMNAAVIQLANAKGIPTP